LDCDFPLGNNSYCVKSRETIDDVNISERKILCVELTPNYDYVLVPTRICVRKMVFLLVGFTRFHKNHFVSYIYNDVCKEWYFYNDLNSTGRVESDVFKIQAPQPDTIFGVANLAFYIPLNISS